MTKKLQPVTMGVRDAAIFAALASGCETHQAIADRLGLSREHVSRAAAKHRKAIEAEAAKTMQAAVDGPAQARQKAADATPRAIGTMIEIMDGDGAPGDAVRLAAAKALCDRGGVPVRSEIDAAIATDPDRLIRLRAMLRAKGDDE